jgi:hypothetical protein
MNNAILFEEDGIQVLTFYKRYPGQGPPIRTLLGDIGKGKKS